VVCDKRLPDLKPLYIDAFGTLARLSVIAIALEAIIHHSSLKIPTKKNSLDLWSFEKLANANKPDHLANIRLMIFSRLISIRDFETA
jgi:hypothetical protein